MFLKNYTMNNSNKPVKYICKEEYEIHSFHCAFLTIPFGKEVLIADAGDGVFHNLILDVSGFFLQVYLDEWHKNHHFTLHNPVLSDEK